MCEKFDFFFLSSSYLCATDFCTLNYWSYSISWCTWSYTTGNYRIGLYLGSISSNNLIKNYQIPESYLLCSPYCIKVEITCQKYALPCINVYQHGYSKFVYHIFPGRSLLFIIVKKREKMIKKEILIKKLLSYL